MRCPDCHEEECPDRCPAYSRIINSDLDVRGFAAGCRDQGLLTDELPMVCPRRYRDRVSDRGYDLRVRAPGRDWRLVNVKKRGFVFSDAYDRKLHGAPIVSEDADYREDVTYVILSADGRGAIVLEPGLGAGGTVATRFDGSKGGMRTYRDVAASEWITLREWRKNLDSPQGAR